MKKTLASLLVIVMIFCIVGCSPKKADNSEKLETFHAKVKESQELLDAVADDIYSNWYDAIYKDAFNEDINTAIMMAQLDHYEDLEQIDLLEEEITELFKEIKDDEDNGRLVKDVMSAYSDYYEFVVNVSGSFNSYKADKETLKKELASLLKDLSYEL